MGTLLDLVDEAEEELMPTWVSDKNASMKAFLAVKELFQIKSKYIETSRTKANFTRVSDWQISVSEVAKYISVSRVTIGSTANYARDLKKHIAEVNQQLSSQKSQVEKKIKKAQQNGRKARRKSEILKLNQQLRQELEELEKRQTVELLERTVEKLPLPVRQALGFV